MNWTISLMVLLIAFPSSSVAKGPMKHAPADRHGVMQEKLEQRPSYGGEPAAEKLQALRKMPPESRKVFRQRLERWKEMSPDEQARLRTKLRRFQSLAPGEQEALRRGFHHLQSLPSDERARVVRDLKKWKNLPPEQRGQIRQMLAPEGGRYGPRPQNSPDGIQKERPWPSHPSP